MMYLLATGASQTQGTEMNSIDRAFNLLETDLDEDLLATVIALANGGSTWVVDPVNDDVVALVEDGTNAALIVVYLADRDFEISEDLEEIAYPSDDEHWATDQANF